MMKKQTSVLSLLVNNKPDVLARIAGVLSARGYNIESISANTTEDPTRTKIVITTGHSREMVKKIEKQLNNIVDVLAVENYSLAKVVHRELLLVRIMPREDQKDLLEKTIAEQGGRVISREEGQVWFIELTGGEEDTLKGLALLKPYGMVDYTRTGVVALASSLPEDHEITKG
jgi:acetolactate synthase-1/3 small subunit